MLCVIFHPSNTLLERIGPVGYLDTKGFLNLGLVEHGIGGTLYGTGKLVAMAGLYIARGGAVVLGYHLGEVVPRTHALVGIVVDARLGIRKRRCRVNRR